MSDAIHDPSAVIPRHDRPRVREVGSVQDMGGLPLHVGVNGAAVVISGHILDEARLETFMQLAIRAAWLAAQE